MLRHASVYLLAREFRPYMDFDILTGPLPVKISKSIYSLNSRAIYLHPRSSQELTIQQCHSQVCFKTRGSSLTSYQILDILSICIEENTHEFVLHRSNENDKHLRKYCPNI